MTAVGSHPRRRPRVLLLTHRGTPPDLDRVRAVAEVVPADEPRLAEQLRDADVLYIWDYFWDRQVDGLERAWPADAGVRWVHIANVGTEKIDFAALHRSGPIVTNAAGVYETAIAEYVLAAHLYLCKRLHEVREAQVAGEWRRLETDPVAGGSAVVVGAGPIGRQIARLLGAVGMRVDLVARTARADAEFGRVHGSDALTGLLPGCDLLVLAAPLTPRTRHMIGRDELALLGPRGRLVNVGRGALVDDEALIDALAGGRIAGAALDVFVEEPLPASSPYRALPNCLVSAHMSGVTHGWRDRLADVFTRNLCRWIEGDELLNVVPGMGARR